MKTSAKLTGLLLSSCLIACQPVQDEGNSSREASAAHREDRQAVMSPAATAVLAENELANQKEAALSGDSKAAAVVAEHYFGTSAATRADQLYWLSIAAENGAPGAMYNYAMMLRNVGGVDNCLRAKFWLDKVISSDASEDVKRQAMEFLEDLEGSPPCNGEQRGRSE